MRAIPGYINPHYRPSMPIRLKSLVLDCDIKQLDLAIAAGTSQPTINLCLAKGYMPPTCPNFVADIEMFISTHRGAGRYPSAPKWLQEHGLQLADIWQPQAEQRHRERPPCGYLHPKTKAIIPGNPDTIEDQEEKDMRKIKIHRDTLKYFKLFRDPFSDDPRTEKEVFRSDDHRYLEYAMADAATNSGLIAVIAEVGAGKTVMRREVIEKLKADEKTRIVYPQILDKKRISASSLCDAIIMDLTKEPPKQKLEAKSRQVKALLLERLKQGKRVCLLVEEAHTLTIDALKHLKVLHEFEDGRQKLLSIVILGQPELATKLDEEQYPELRELSRRIQIAMIPGLGNNTWDYLKLKFAIVGGDIDNIITAEAVQRLVDRLTTIDPGTRQKVSLAYPLTVNNYLASAMKMAHDMGEEKITADVVDAI